MLGSARQTNVYDQISKMQAEISDLTSQLSKFAAREKKHAAGLANSIADTVTDRYNNYSGQISNFADTATDHADAVQSFVMSEVKKHPLRTLVVAGLIGVVFGAMSRSK